MNETSESKKYWRVRKKTIYIIGGLFLVIVTPIFIWLFSEMSGAGKALDAFGQMLIAKDYEGAYSAASPDFQIAIGKQDFIGQQKALCAKLGSLKRVKRGGSETTFDSKGGFTTVDTTLIFETGERQFTFTLKKVGDRWRVYGYKGE